MELSGFWEHFLSSVAASTVTLSIAGALFDYLIRHRLNLALERAKAELSATVELRKEAAKQRMAALLELEAWIEQYGQACDKLAEYPLPQDYDRIRSDLRMFTPAADFQRLEALLNRHETEDKTLNGRELHDFIREQLLGAG